MMVLRCSSESAAMARCTCALRFFRATRSSSEVMVVKCLDAGRPWLAVPLYQVSGRTGRAGQGTSTMRGSGPPDARPMIQLAQLHKTFGDRVLFDHVTWQIGDRERVG